MFGRAARKVPDVLSRLTGRVSVIGRSHKIAGSLIAQRVLKTARIVEPVYPAVELPGIHCFEDRLLCSCRQFGAQSFISMVILWCSVMLPPFRLPQR